MIYTVFLDGRIDSSHETNGGAKEAIEEMVNWQEIDPKRIKVRKCGELLMLEFRQIYNVSIGGC